MPLRHVDPANYDNLLAAKIERLMPGFEALEARRANDKVPDIFKSPVTGFRMRAEFRIWHEGDTSDYVMFAPEDRKTPIVINDFPIAHESIQRLMPALKNAIEKSPALRHKLFQVEFLTTSTGEILTTLIYHRPLDEAWIAAAEELSATLQTKLIGRSRKQKILLDTDWVDESLTVNSRTFVYRQPDGAFTQPNARVNEHMIGWAVEQARGLGGDMLELYCGIGNFTLPLSTVFDNVLATELSKPATAAAKHNLAVNQIDNVEFARLSAEEMSEAMNNVRPFRRLAELKKPLGDYNFKTLFVDPPRAGLDDLTRKLAASFDNILYISCNPETLLRDLNQLNETHSVVSLAFFDQFPYTNHLECGVLLKARLL